MVSACFFLVFFNNSRTQKKFFCIDSSTQHNHEPGDREPTQTAVVSGNTRKKTFSLMNFRKFGSYLRYTLTEPRKSPTMCRFFNARWNNPDSRQQSLQYSERSHMFPCYAPHNSLWYHPALGLVVQTSQLILVWFTSDVCRATDASTT